jgi:Protein of unknown function (DUF1569)
MNRRNFVQISTLCVAAPSVLVACVSGYDRALSYKTFDEALTEFTRIVAAKKIRSHSADDAPGWSLAHIAEHCAQSIEFSMNGFPSPKSALFQSTVGKAAIAVFSARGKMSHSTNEPIPGALALNSTQVVPALDRLRAAANGLTQFNGTLKPHFAYGALTKPEMISANVFHIANHLSKIEVIEAKGKFFLETFDETRSFCAAGIVAQYEKSHSPY